MLNLEKSKKLTDCSQLNDSNTWGALVILDWIFDYRELYQETWAYWVKVRGGSLCYSCNDSLPLTVKIKIKRNKAGPNYNLTGY